MARIPDYEKMREELALYEADNLGRSDLSDILLFGTSGYRQMEDEDVISIYVDVLGAKQIPKIEMGETNGKR